MIFPILDKNMTLLQASESFSHYLLQNESGTGRLLFYNVLPGLQFFFCNFHLTNFQFTLNQPGEHLIVLHCHSGMAEWNTSHSQTKNFEENGLMLLNRFPNDVEYKYPLRRYHGIGVAISLSPLSSEISNMFSMIDVDFPSVIHQMQSLQKPFTLRADDRVKHIFSELYHLPKDIRFPYFKIKTLELLLFLSRLDSETHYENRNFVPGIYQKKLMALREFLRKNADRHYTLEELAQRTEMSPTQMKKYFKLSYGFSIYSYLKTYRMKLAVQMLSEENANISTIASRVGYTNSSKFAHAFKEYAGCTPKEFRNKHSR